MVLITCFAGVAAEAQRVHGIFQDWKIRQLCPRTSALNCHVGAEDGGKTDRRAPAVVTNTGRALLKNIFIQIYHIPFNSPISSTEVNDF